MHKLLDYEPKPAKDRKLGQKITLLISYSCFLGTLISMAGAVYFGMQSVQTPAFASMLALIVFFSCVGLLLYVLGSGNLPSLKIDDHPEQETIN